MKLQDGRGTGRAAEVDENFRLKTNTVTRSLIHEATEDGKAWVLPLDNVQPSRATWFFILKNDGQATYAIFRLRLNSSAAGIFRFAQVSGTPAGGSDIAPVAHKLTSNAGVDALTIQSGASLAGLTESRIIFPQYLGANTPLDMLLDDNILVPPGTAVALKAPGAATVNGSVHIYIEE